MIKQIDAVYILLALFILCSAANFFKVPIDQTILATIFVALNVRNGVGNGNGNGNGTTPGNVASPDSKTPANS